MDEIVEGPEARVFDYPRGFNELAHGGPAHQTPNDLVVGDIVKFAQGRRVLSDTESPQYLAAVIDLESSGGWKITTSCGKIPPVRISNLGKRVLPMHYPFRDDLLGRRDRVVLLRDTPGTPNKGFQNGNQVSSSS